MAVATHTARHAWTLQIRAVYDADSITVYQAFSAAIADAAVAEQRLDAAPDFSLKRGTWIKPSWTWMLYRSGYAAKDARQERILAIRMTRDGFHELLRNARLTGEVGDHTSGDGDGDTATAPKTVRVQWDPERTPRIERIDNMRSIQVGISREWIQPYVERMILSIEDVTARARELKATLDAEPDIDDAELLRRGLLPDERLYALPDDIRDAIQRRSRRETKPAGGQMGEVEPDEAASTSCQVEA
jgi:hypothetical protein